MCEQKAFLLKELPLTEIRKLRGALSVGTIQEVNIGSVKLGIPLNIWMYILGKQLDMDTKERIQINNSKMKVLIHRAFIELTEPIIHICRGGQQ